TRTATSTPTATRTATRTATSTPTATRVDAPERSFRVYLPVVAQLSEPDLIVERIAVVGGQVQVTIKNIGGAAVTNAFWVDAYINPAVPPTHVNETWPKLGKQGLVWGVTSGGLPLAPNAGLTLVVGDQFYHPALSQLSTPIAPGDVIYAQVDSANVNTDYGAVLESHELHGGPYNNISSITVGR
ncbi:MAG TPA: hypothetical protein PKK15_10385, partial [Kouleothrix sp.]|nr:hypothetical protein [Kouleothrix sp.]